MMPDITVTVTTVREIAARALRKQATTRTDRASAKLLIYLASWAFMK